eukprot:165547_1
MNTTDLNTLNPKTYGNLIINKHIHQKCKNRHNSDRNRYFKGCRECRDTCRDPHQCRYIPRRRNLKQIIKQELQMYHNSKYNHSNNYNEDEPDDIYQDQISNDTLLFNHNIPINIGSEYGQISLHTQSQILKYPFLQQILPLLKSLNNYSKKFRQLSSSK